MSASLQKQDGLQKNAENKQSRSERPHRNAFCVAVGCPGINTGTQYYCFKAPVRGWTTVSEVDKSREQTARA